MGPTAVPAFWRENYSSLDQFDLKELLDILGLYIRIGFSKKSFYYAKMLLAEMRKYSKENIVDDAELLSKIRGNI